jgi:NAD(P)-dependent dehydrogenase (short-subunit alcohol dehydrogenase family)
LNNLLIDLLKKSDSARIINISSAIHRWAKMDLNDLQYDRRKYHFMKAYAQSKLLMTMATFELARRVDGTGITVNCLHPGAVKTSLGSNSANNIVLKLVDKAIKSFFITPAKAAKWPVYLATAAEMQNITGKYFAKGKVVSANPITADLALAKKVWEMSEKMVHLIA